LLSARYRRLPHLPSFPTRRSSDLSADANCQAAVPNVTGGVSVGDACSSPGAITLRQLPAAGTVVGLGTHIIIVTATDEAGNSASCTTTFAVTNSAVPTVICSAVVG